MSDLLMALPFIFAWCLFLEFVVGPILDVIADGISEIRYRRRIKRRQTRSRDLGIDPDSPLATFL